MYISVLHAYLPGTHGGQQKALNTLELELQMVASHSGEDGYQTVRSPRAATALNH